MDEKRQNELLELFGPPETIIQCECVPHEKARSVTRLQVIQATNDIRMSYHPAWSGTIPHLRALLLGM